MRKRFLVVALVAGFLAASLGAMPPATAALHCPPPAAVVGRGVLEQRILQYDLYIPAHEVQCTASVGMISFAQKAEADAIIDMQNRNVNFIALNQPMNAAEWVYTTSSARNTFSSAAIVYHLPMMLQGFAVTTNITACPTPAGGLRLTPRTLSLIYSGVITTWGDPLIAGDQIDPAAIEGCPEQIAIGLREGDGWSNAVLKDYMSKENPAFVALRQREAVGTWPANLDIDCRGRSDNGMIGCGAMSGAISYMPYRTAKASGLDIASLKNGAGKYPKPVTNNAHQHASGCTAAVPPLLTSFDTAAITARGEYLPPLQADWSQVSLTYAKKGYALCSFHYVLAFQGAVDSSQMEVEHLKDHLTIMASAAMQQRLPAYGYTPLPSALFDAVNTTVRGIDT